MTNDLNSTYFVKAIIESDPGWAVVATGRGLLNEGQTTFCFAERPEGLRIGDKFRVDLVVVESAI